MIYVLKIKYNLGDNHKASHQDPHKNGENLVLSVLKARPSRTRAMFLLEVREM